jgi:hypothetical protein
MPNITFPEVIKRLDSLDERESRMKSFFKPRPSTRSRFSKKSHRFSYCFDNTDVVRVIEMKFAEEDLILNAQ